MSLEPAYPEAMANLGLALQAMGRRAEAAEQFRRAIELRPGFAAAHNNLGYVLRESGRIDEALVHFRRAIELDPADALARTNLGQMLLERGQAAEALPHCEEAVRLMPQAAALAPQPGKRAARLASLRRGSRGVRSGDPARSWSRESARAARTLAQTRASARGSGGLSQARDRAGPRRPGTRRIPRRSVPRPAEFSRSDQLLHARDRDFTAWKEPGRISRWDGRFRKTAGWARLLQNTGKRSGFSRAWPPCSLIWAVTTKSAASWHRPKPTIGTRSSSSPTIRCPWPSWALCCAASFRPRTRRRSNAAWRTSR